MRINHFALPASAGVSLLCLLLSACGGGISEDEARAGSGSGTGGSTGSNGATNNYTLGDISIGDGQSAIVLAAGGSTTVSVAVKGTGTTPAEVNFTSECQVLGKASFSNSAGANSATATPIDGVATVRFTDKGCGGKDKITASIGNSRKQVSLDIERSVVQSIEFKSAQPGLISLKGTGGNETSTVTFEVKGNLGTPLANVPVQLKLNTEVGGLCITDTTASTCTQSVEVVSDLQGLVTGLVRAGSISTPVRVTATNLESNTYTVSNAPVVSTGVPDQDSFSLSLSEMNPHGWEKDGTEVTVNVYLADAFNNPAPEGTGVSFWTEGGIVTPTCSIDANGSCQVVWRSSNPRPADGVVTVLAFAQGNESFVDLNGNGFYEYGVDRFTSDDDLAEAFLDVDMDGTRDGGNEAFVDFNRNGQYDGANGVYNGVLCLDENQQCVKSGVSIRQSVQLAMSSNEVGLFELSAPLEIDPNDTVDFQIYLADINGNSLPSGTEVTIVGDPLVSFTVHNGGIPKLLTLGRNVVNVTATTGDKTSAGVFIVKVNSAGLITSRTFPINPRFHN